MLKIAAQVQFKRLAALQQSTILGQSVPVEKLFVSIDRYDGHDMDSQGQRDFREHLIRAGSQ